MKKPKLRTYGHGQTVHGTNLVNVETDEHGVVVAVWFRCQPLPFDQTKVDTNRAREMKRQYDEYKVKLHAVVLEDK